MIRRIILHIGQHRTGIRSLQQQLAGGRPQLARTGIIYPDLGPVPGQNHGHHLLASPWMQLPGQVQNAFDPWAQLAQICANFPQTGEDTSLLLCAESLSRASPERVDMADLAGRLRALFAPEAEILVVVSLRDQRRLVQELWLELARHQQPPVPGPFLARALANHIAAGVWLDYNKLLDQLLMGFAPNQIHFLDHDQIEASPAGLTAALLALAAPKATSPAHWAAALAQSLPPRPEADFEDPTGDHGHPLAVLAAHLIAAEGPPARDLMARLIPALPQGTPSQNSLPQLRSQLLSRAEWETFSAHFAPLNARFEARLAQVQPEFCLSPAPPPARHSLHREDMGAELWADLASYLLHNGAPEALHTASKPPNLPQRMWRRILDICLE